MARLRCHCTLAASTITCACFIASRRCRQVRYLPQVASRVVLHVGTMKSATTYLQAAFDLNTDLLAEGNVLWSGAAFNFAGFADRLGGEEFKRPNEGDWPSLVSAVDGFPDTVLLSNELLSIRRRPKLSPMLDEVGWPVEVVITARDLGRVIPSQWGSGALNRRPTPWHEFIRELVRDNRDHEGVAWFWRRQNLRGIVDTWAGMVGADAVTVVTVPPPGAAADVVLTRFMEVVGVDPTPLQQPPRDATNGIATTEFIRRLAKTTAADLPRQRWAEVVDAARTRADVDPPEPHIGLTADQLAWATDQASSMVEHIANSGVRVVGDLADLIPDPSIAHEAETPAPTDAELLAVALRTLSRFATDLS